MEILIILGIIFGCLIVGSFAFQFLIGIVVAAVAMVQALRYDRQRKKLRETRRRIGY